jgi:hypothetical protein
MESVGSDAQRSANQLRTRPLSSALGAEIIGVDLSRPMSDELFEKIRQCWHDNVEPISKLRIGVDRL